jgi:hypothetical protein
MSEEQKYYLQLIEAKFNAQRPITDLQLLDKVNTAISMLKNHLKLIDKRRHDDIKNRELHVEKEDLENQINFLNSQIGALSAQNSELKQAHERDFSYLQDALHTSISTSKSARTSLGSQAGKDSNDSTRLLREKHVAVLLSIKEEIKRMSFMIENQPNRTIDIEVITTCRTVIDRLTNVLAEKDDMLFKMQDSKETGTYSARSSISTNFDFGEPKHKSKRAPTHGQATTEERIKLLIEWIRTTKAIRRLGSLLIQDVKDEHRFSDEKKTKIIRLISKIGRSSRKEERLSEAALTDKVYITVESLNDIRETLHTINRRKRVDSGDSTTLYRDYTELVSKVEQLHKSLTKQQHFTQVYRTLDRKSNRERREFTT